MARGSTTSTKYLYLLLLLVRGESQRARCAGVIFLFRGERSALSRSFILLQPIRGQRLFTQTSPNMPRKCPNFPPPSHALSLFKFCHPVTVVEHKEVARAVEGEI